MISVRAVACVVLLVLSTGVGAASAGALDEAAERYRPYMIEGIGQALAGARTLRECAAAADRAGAKQAWIAARAGWERSEVFTAGFVPELDALIDAWPNADHGFHAIEARLFGAGQTDVGTRVPTLLVSKRFDESGVAHEDYDTTSIIRTLERRFDLAPLVSRPVRSLGSALKAANSGRH